MITIYDIAEKAGLSPSTVSKVLNNYKGVSKKTREKVKNAVKEFDYVPNLSARTLMLKKSYMVGVLLKEDGYLGMLHPHFSEILESFRREMETYGYDVLFLTNKIGSQDTTYLTHCKHRSLDGVMLAASDIDCDNSGQIKQLACSDFPAVSVEDYYEDTCTVISNNMTGTFKALDYLRFLGHEKITCVTVGTNSVAAKERLYAYQLFHEKNNLELNADRIIQVPRFNYQSGLEAVKQFLKNGFRDLSSAIFCVYDEIAIGMIEELKKYNILVPDDVSIIGFDDLPLANYFGLTTIRQDRKQIGILAAKKLKGLIEKTDTDSNNIILEAEIVVRKTCKKIIQN